MRVRFLMPVSMVKIENGNQESSFSAKLDQMIIANKVVETDDPNFVDIYQDIGIIKGINRSIIEVFQGVIEPYEETNIINDESNEEYEQDI